MHNHHNHLVTHSNHQQPFRLLDLPPELWLKIGKLAIDSTPLLLKSNHICNIMHSSEERRASASLWQPAITRVCVPLRVELLPYYYQTRVEEGNWPVRSGSVCLFLEAIGRENRKMIRAMSLARPVLSEEERRCEGERGELRMVWGVEVEIEREGRAIQGWPEYAQHRVKFV